MGPLDILEDQGLLEKLKAHIKELESREQGGFEKYIHLIKSYHLPQPQTESWA